MLQALFKYVLPEDFLLRDKKVLLEVRRRRWRTLHHRHQQGS
jgi:hypothetical protein